MAQIIAMESPTGLGVLELEEFREWNVTALPSTAAYTAANLGLRCIVTATGKSYVLIDSGGGVMVWEGQANDTEVAAAVASGFTGITAGTPVGDITFSGNGTAASPLFANVTAGTIVPADLDPTFSLDDLPGTPSTPINAGTQIINNVGTPVAATDAATKSYVDTAISGVDPLGQFRGAYPTLLAAQTAFPAAGHNGDHITLSAVDGVNNPGIYQSDGTNWVLAYEFANPDVIGPATVTTAGIVELATDAEALTATDNSRALTPANLSQFQMFAGEKVNNPAGVANNPMVVTTTINPTDVVSVVGRQLVAQPFGAAVGNYGNIGERHDFTSSISATTPTSVAIGLGPLAPVANAYELLIIAAV